MLIAIFDVTKSGAFQFKGQVTSTVWGIAVEYRDTRNPEIPRRPKMFEIKKQIWLKVFCPDDAYLTEEERITLPESDEAEKHDRWLEIFCPDNSCEIIWPSQTP